jgi:putative ABC transport system permease protein
VGTRIDLMPAGFITPRGKLPPSHNLTEAEVRAVRHIAGVAAVSESFVNRDPALRSEVETPHVLGTSPDPQLALDAGGFPRILAGRGLTVRDGNAQVAITSPELAHANGWRLSTQFSLHGTVVTLVGLFTTGNPDGDNYLILPYETDVRIYHLRDPHQNPLHLTAPSHITVYAARSSLVPQVVGRLRQVLGHRIDVIAQQQTAGQVDALGGVRQNVEAGVMGAIATAVLAILFAVLLLVRERTREIGVLKALGASTIQVVGQFAVEVLVLTGSAATIAAVLLAFVGPSVSGAWGLTGGRVELRGPVPGVSFGELSTPPLTAGLTAENLAVLCTLAVGLAVLASAVPAWYVARLKPARVLSQTV